MDKVHRFELALKVIGDVGVHQPFGLCPGGWVEPQQAAGLPPAGLEEAQNLQSIDRKLSGSDPVAPTPGTKDASVGRAQIADLRFQFVPAANTGKELGLIANQTQQMQLVVPGRERKVAGDAQPAKGIYQ